MIRRYNECIQPEALQEELTQKRKLQFSFGPSLGVSAYKIAIFTSDDFLRTSERGTVLYYGATVSAYFIENFTLQSGLFYYQYQPVEESVPYSFGNIDKSYSIRTLEVPLTLKYSPSKKPIIPHLLLGLRAAFPLESEGREIRTRFEEIERDDTFDIDYTRIYGFTLGLGNSVKLGDNIHLNADLTYNRLDAFSETDADLIITSYAFQLSLLF